MAGGRRHRRPRPAGWLGRPGRARGGSRRASWDSIRCGSTRVRGRRATGGQRRPPAPRGMRLWTRSPPSSARPPCCSATPSTIRPRRCCSAWRAAAGPTSLQGMAPRAGLYRRPLLGIRRADHRAGVRRCRARAVERPAQRRPRLRPRASAPHRAAAARGRARSRASPRRSPARPSSCARTPRRSTPSPHEVAEDLAEHAEAGVSLCRSPPSPANPAALRQRLIRLVVQSEFGVSLSRAQTARGRPAGDRLARAGTGVDLPGVRVERRGGRIHLVSTEAGALTG